MKKTLKRKVSNPRACFWSFSNSGFTLVELMVTISIFTIISIGLFINYPKFREGLSLKRTAQEIALTVREAQVSAISVKEFDGKFPGYGVHFSVNSPDSFILFVDLDGNGEYSGGPEKEKEIKIKTTDIIYKLCVGEKTIPTPDCSLSEFNIVYYRPGPKVVFKGGGVDYSNHDLEVIIKSSAGVEKQVTIWPTGQIEVD